MNLNCVSGIKVSVYYTKHKEIQPEYLGPPTTKFGQHINLPQKQNTVISFFTRSLSDMLFRKK